MPSRLRTLYQQRDIVLSAVKRIAYSRLRLIGQHNRLSGAAPLGDVSLLVKPGKQPISKPWLAWHKRIGAEHLVTFTPADRDAAVAAVTDWGAVGLVHSHATAKNEVDARDVAEDLYKSALSSRWCAVLAPGEFLIHPFTGARSLGDLGQFLTDERRAHLFALEIDLYGDPEVEREDCNPGDQGWFFDRFGYRYCQNWRLGVQQWSGGFAHRFPEVAPPRIAELSRIVMFIAKPKLSHPTSWSVMMPREQNTTSAKWHLTPTGCVVSTVAYQRFLKIYRAAEPARRQFMRAKLLSAPREEFDWSDRRLIQYGLLVPGQWF